MIQLATAFFFFALLGGWSYFVEDDDEAEIWPPRDWYVAGSDRSGVAFR